MSGTETCAVPDLPGNSSSHEAAGLDLARSVAGALRGIRSRRPRQGSRRAGRRAEPQASGAHPDDRDPAPLGAVVDKLVADRGWSVDLAVRGVFAKWPAIVGFEVASHCTPESFRDGVVEVRTDSTAWATQLKLLAPTVVRRLNEELGDGTVSRIDVRGPLVPSWRRGRRSVRDGRGPRDTYG